MMAPLGFDLIEFLQLLESDRPLKIQWFKVVAQVRKQVSVVDLRTITQPIRKTLITCTTRKKVCGADTVAIATPPRNTSSQIYSLRVI